MCALNIQIRKFYFSWLIFLVFGFCVSNVIEKSLADSRRAGRPINPFMTMIKNCHELNFSLHLGGSFQS